MNHLNLSSYAKVTAVLPRPLQQISALRKSHFHGVDLCSGSINLIDLRVLHLDLRSTVYPDGGQPTGRGKSCHDLCITITETRSRNQPSTLTCATDLIDPHLNRSTYLICISLNLSPHSGGFDATVGTRGTLC